jgi:hypothetical protein
MSRLMPWGNAVGKRLAGKVTLRGSRGRGRGNPDPALRSMDYPRNDPAKWPVLPDPATGRVGNDTLKTTRAAKDAKHNSAIETAYDKLNDFPGGLG